MIVRLIAGLLMLSVGALSLYILVKKPQHDWSKSEVDQAFGIPPIVNRTIRGIFSVVFIIVGLIAILRALNLLP